jgi:hypothetical protein
MNAKKGHMVIKDIDVAILLEKACDLSLDKLLKART